MRLNLSKFKLKHNDGKTAILIHPAGHEMRVAVRALHPDSRKELDSVTPTPHPDKIKLSAAEKQHFAQGGEAGHGYQPCLNPNCKSHGMPHPNCKCYGNMAKGGPVDGSKGCKCCMADGGEVSRAIKPFREGAPTGATNLPADEIPAPDRVQDAPIEGYGAAARMLPTDAGTGGVEPDPLGQAVLDTVATAGMGTLAGMAKDSAGIASNEIGSVGRNIAGAARGNAAIEAGDTGAAIDAANSMPKTELVSRAEHEAALQAARQEAYEQGKAAASVPKSPVTAGKGVPEVGPDVSKEHMAFRQETKNTGYSPIEAARLQRSKSKMNFAEGGDVEQQSPTNSDAIAQMNQQSAALNPQQTPQQPQQPPQGTPPPNPQGNEQEATKKAMKPQADPLLQDQIQQQQIAAQTAQEAMTSSGDITGANTMAQNLMGGVNQAQLANDQLAKGNIDYGQALNKAAIAQVTAATNQKKATDAEYAPLAQEAQDITHDVLQGHVDPNQLWNSKSGWQKMSTGIGIALGGLGSGMTGGPNQALQFFQEQIKNNIAAQEQTIHNKNTLLGHLSTMYSPAVAAKVAEGQLNAILAAKIEAAGANLKTPQAIAQKNALSGALKMQSSQALGQAAAKLSAVRNPQNASLPALRVSARTEGTPNYAPAMEELGRAQTLAANRSKALNLFDAYAQVAGPGGAALSPIERQTRKALFENNLPGIATSSGVDMKIVNSHTPKSWNDESQVEEMRNAIDSQFKSQMKGYPHLDTALPDMAGDYSKLAPAKREQYVEWARRQPATNIKAQMILKKYGQK